MCCCRQLRERRTQAEAELASVSHRRGPPALQAARESSTLSPHQRRKAATAAATALRGVTFRQGDILQLVGRPQSLPRLHMRL